MENQIKEQLDIYNQGVKDGKQHAVMSPETREMFKIISEKVNEINISLVALPGVIYERISCKFEEHKKEDDSKYEKLIAELDKRYAAKPAEWIAYTIVGLICTGVLAALISQVVIASQ